MSKLKQKLTRQRLRSQDKTDNKGNLFLGSLVATLIAATPFMFNLYESVPDGKVWNTFLFTYESPYYENVQVLVWTLTNKFVPLLLLFIWFFTCRQWWYHTLLVPIAMYIYQIIVILNDDLQFADTNQIVYLLPIMAIVFPSIYLIRAQMFSSIIDVNKTMEELEEEFKIKPKSFVQRLGDYF